MAFGSMQNRHVRRTSRKIITRCDEIHMRGSGLLQKHGKQQEPRRGDLMKPSWKKGRREVDVRPKEGEGNTWQAENNI